MNLFFLRAFFRALTGRVYLVEPIMSARVLEVAKNINQVKRWRSLFKTISILK